MSQVRGKELCLGQFLVSVLLINLLFHQYKHKHAHIDTHTHTHTQSYSLCKKVSLYRSTYRELLFRCGLLRGAAVHFNVSSLF